MKEKNRLHEVFIPLESYFHFWFNTNSCGYLQMQANFCI